MPYRSGDPVTEIEGTIQHATAKAYLIRTEWGKVREIWLPKSQVVGMSEPDEDGTRRFTVAQWWYDRAEIG